MGRCRPELGSRGGNRRVFDPPHLSLPCPQSRCPRDRSCSRDRFDPIGYGRRSRPKPSSSLMSRSTLPLAASSGFGPLDDRPHGRLEHADLVGRVDQRQVGAGVEAKPAHSSTGFLASGNSVPHLFLSTSSRSVTLSRPPTK